MSFNVDGLNYCALAHEIVDLVGCSFCGAQPKGRCKSLRRGGNPNDPYDFRWLAPSRSHQTRINAYWLSTNRRPGGLPIVDGKVYIGSP